MELLLLITINLIINLLPYIPYIIIGLSIIVTIYELYFNNVLKNEVKQNKNKNKLYKMDVDFITYPRPRM